MHQVGVGKWEGMGADCLRFTQSLDELVQNPRGDHHIIPAT
jgi:hypothetical protein